MGFEKIMSGAYQRYHSLTPTQKKIVKGLGIGAAALFLGGAFSTLACLGLQHLHLVQPDRLALPFKASVTTASVGAVLTLPFAVLGMAVKLREPAYKEEPPAVDTEETTRINTTLEGEIGSNGYKQYDAGSTSDAVSQIFWQAVEKDKQAAAHKAIHGDKEYATAWFPFKIGTKEWYGVIIKNATATSLVSKDHFELYVFPDSKTSLAFAKDAKKQLT